MIDREILDFRGEKGSLDVMIDFFRRPRGGRLKKRANFVSYLN